MRNKRPAPGLIHQSDRGSQYCVHDYQKLVKQFGMQASMSRRGNCYDNVPMESFWGSLKNELVHHQRYATRADARAAIQEYIDSCYNRQRRHSRLANVPPALFAEKFSKQQQAWRSDGRREHRADAEAIDEQKGKGARWRRCHANRVDTCAAPAERYGRALDQETWQVLLRLQGIGQRRQALQAGTQDQGQHGQRA
ncbi:transposase [Massilia antarctica]|uniref:Transposase n=1 Tax=Massilia antarctica TaxID=2765360 RepID=A0AA48W9D3_9BURK|nr:transposase [Massilia antarctica]